MYVCLEASCYKNLHKMELQLPAEPDSTPCGLSYDFTLLALYELKTFLVVNFYVKTRIWFVLLKFKNSRVTNVISCLVIRTATLI